MGTANHRLGQNKEITSLDKNLKVRAVVVGESDGRKLPRVGGALKKFNPHALPE